MLEILRFPCSSITLHKSIRVSLPGTIDNSFHVLLSLFITQLLSLERFWIWNSHDCSIRGVIMENRQSKGTKEWEIVIESYSLEKYWKWIVHFVKLDFIALEKKNKHNSINDPWNSTKLLITQWYSCCITFHSIWNNIHLPPLNSSKNYYNLLLIILFVKLQKEVDS